MLGLSGGIDSALVAVLAMAALGKENVRGISLPSQFSSQGSLDDARILAENLGIVPRGTTKANQARIHVADALAAPAPVAAAPITTRTDGGARSATWLASNGRVRHGRGR